MTGMASNTAQDRIVDFIMVDAFPLVIGSRHVRDHEHGRDADDAKKLPQLDHGCTDP